MIDEEKTASLNSESFDGTSPADTNGNTGDGQTSRAPADAENASDSSRIAALEERLAEEHDRLLRTAAELDNVRKRARRDVDDASARGRAEVLGELLPVVDALDLALKSADDSPAARAVLDGVEMVRRQFLASTTRFGMEAVESIGRAFDPAYHEAVAQIPSADVPAGGVVEELRRGYSLGGKLLRPAMVVVSAGPSAAAPETSGPEGCDA